MKEPVVFEKRFRSKSLQRKPCHRLNLLIKVIRKTNKQTNKKQKEETFSEIKGILHTRTIRNA